MTNSYGMAITSVFNIEIIFCGFSSVSYSNQPNMMYFINKGAPKTYTFLNERACDQLDVTLDSVSTSAIPVATASNDPNDHTLTMSTSAVDSSYEGVLAGQRIQGDNIENFLLTMCYLHSPTTFV